MANMTNGSMDSISTHKSDGVSDQLKDLVSAGQHKLSDAKDKVLDAKDAVTAQTSSTIKMLATMIKDHPFIAVGVAAGISYLATRLIRR